MRQIIGSTMKQLVICVCLLQAVTTPAFGLDPIAILSPSDVPPDSGNNHFGWSVAISGDYIAIGAPHDPWFNGNAYGAVYVFRRLGPTCVEQDKITALDGNQDDQLGYSVAMDGDVIVAGAPHYFETFPDSGGPGAIYVFRRNENGTPNDPWDDTWPQEAKLTVDRDPQWAKLGYSVAISDDVIVGGRPVPYDLGSGEVFRSEFGQWVHETSLFGSSPELGGLGYSVDIDGERIILGAPGYDGGGGAVYIFGFDGADWLEEARLSNPDSMALDHFGESVSISGNYVIAGAPNMDDVGPGLSAGVVFEFLRDNNGQWAQNDMIFGSNLVAQGEFGYGFGSAVSLEGDLSVIRKRGSPIAFLISQERSNSTKLFASDDSLPVAIAVSGSYAAVSKNIYVVRDHHDLHDYAAFQNCVAQALNKNDAGAQCEPLDITRDGVVSIVDFEKFMGTFSGP